MDSEQIDEISRILHALANDLTIIQTQATLLLAKPDTARAEKISARAATAVDNIKILQTAWMRCHPREEDLP